MAEEKNKWIDAVTKLTKLTQEGQLKWSNQPATRFINDDVQQVESVFTAEYKDKRLRIYKKRYKVEELANPLYAPGIMDRFRRKYPYWTSSVTLEFIDYDGNTLWTFPSVSGIDDLLTSVKYQVAGVKDFLEDILQESGVQSGINSSQHKLGADVKLRPYKEKLLNLLSGDERLLHLLLEAFGGQAGVLRETGATLKSIFEDNEGEQIGRVEAVLAEAGYRTELASDEKHGLWEIETRAADGKKVRIDWELASRPEFQKAVEIYKSL